MINRIFETFLFRHINVEQGEFKKVILLQVNIFLIISVLLILKPLSTSLMLKQYGVDIMPLAYGLIAVAAIIIHLVVSWIRERITLIKSIQLNTLTHIIILSGLVYLLWSSTIPKWMTIGIYIYVNLFALVTVTFFYQYCQSFLTIREAKKIFAYIGIGAIAGGVFGGYFTSVMVAMTGNIGLLIACILFLCTSAYIMFTIHRMQLGDGMDQSNETSEGSTILLTIKNAHVRNMAMIIGLGVIVSKLIDYQFNAIALQSFESDEALTAFLAFWFSNINLIGFFIQLLFVNQIIDRYGVIRSTLIMPILMLLGVGALLIFPVLASAIFIKMIDGSLKQSLYKTSTEINVMALSSDLRSKAKTLIDVVIDSIATGLSGLIIYGLINKTVLDIKWVGISSLIVIAIWLLFILKSKSTYIKELAILVTGVRADNKRDKDIANKYLNDHIQGTSRKSAKRKSILINLLRDELPGLRNAALIQLVDEFGHEVLEEVSFVKDDSSLIIRKKYFAIKLEQINDLNKFNHLYKTLNVESKIVLIGALARTINGNSQQQIKYNLYNRIEALESLMIKNDLPKIYYRTYFKAIADARYKLLYPKISEALIQSNDSDLQTYALFAIRKSKLKYLFNEVYNTDFNGIHIELGLKTLAVFPDLLIQRLKADEIKNWKKMKSRLPALGFVFKQSHLNYLFSLLDHPKTKIKRLALNSIGKLRVNQPTLNFKKITNRNKLKKEINLSKALYADVVKLHQVRDNTLDNQKKETLQYYIKKVEKLHLGSLKALFIYLSIVTERLDMHKVFKSIKRGNHESALDFLDQTLPYNLRKSILPIIELIILGEYNKELMVKHRIRPSRNKKMIKRLFRFDQEFNNLEKILK